MNKLLTMLGIASLGAAAFLAYLKLSNKLTASIKANRQIAGCKPTGCMLLSGLGVTTSVINFKVPGISESFYSGSDRNSILNKLNLIKTQFRAEIQQAANLTNVPENLIAAFIFIESNGNVYASNGNTIGLMQLDPASITDILHLESKNKRLSETEKSTLRQTIGNRLDKIIAMRWMGDGGSFVTALDLQNPSFNVLAGSIYLGILIDEHTEGEELRLDKVIARYNRGYFSKKGLSGDYRAVYTAMPTTTRNYIAKLVGINGVMDILIT
jgi:hypothetical protein